jgi:SAM-dependent methyltransferase
MDGQMLETLEELGNILSCPRCRAQIHFRPAVIACEQCGATYPISEEGIPLLFWPNEEWTDRKDVTDVVKAFYEQYPFPNYDDVDSRESLARKANRGVFARLLDEQIPAGSMVLEVACGTGQMTNFLGQCWKRKVIGADICLNSLRLGKRFRDGYGINNAGFLQMNLFRPCFKDDAFDLVICNGALHHTGDPLGGFRTIGRLVKPGGVILISVYNRIGRLPTDFRRWIIRTLGDNFGLLDDHMRDKNYSAARKRSWFMDQYKHPHESKHTFSEVLEWLDSTGFEFLSSIPKIESKGFKADEKLFELHSRGTRVTRFLAELEMLLKGGADGGVFIVIGRRTVDSHADAPISVRRFQGSAPDGVTPTPGCSRASRSAAPSAWSPLYGHIAVRSRRFPS